MNRPCPGKNIFFLPIMTKNLLAVFILVVIACFPTLWCGAQLLPDTHPMSSMSSPENGEGLEVQQFTSGGHIIAFRPDGVYLAKGDHLLSVKYVGRTVTSPHSDAPADGKDTVSPLSKVTYTDLWPGISLVYENTSGGVLKSTYLLEPGSNAETIRLAYNRRPEIDGKGNMVCSFERGQMVEAAPIAWQIINDIRHPVEISFKLHGDNEVGFSLGEYDRRYALVIDPVMYWTTYLGSSSNDEARGIVFESNSYVYVTGKSEGAWYTGVSPKRGYSGGEDAFVAKLDSDGSLIWHTFLGSADDDEGFEIIYRATNDVLVVGESAGGWGASPVRAHQGGYDGFIAQVDGSTGILEWNTFLGGSGNDYGRSIANDGAYVAVTGYSGGSWNNGSTSPLNGFTGSFDAFVVNINTLGNINWHTFLGSASADRGMGIVVNTDGVYIAGYSNATWGTAYRSYSGLNDGFLAKLSRTGTFEWNTFFGSASNDYSYGVDCDSSGNIYVVGQSFASWIGSHPPLRDFTGGRDVFVVKVSSAGLMHWNTFLGSSDTDYGYDLAVHDNSYIYVTGGSEGSWESPVVTHSGDRDAFLAQLDIDGAFQWVSFRGSASYDLGHGIALNYSGVPFIVGESSHTWGSNPVIPNSGYDGFISMSSTSGNNLMVSFLGGASEDASRAIELDGSGNIFIAGYSQSSWGTSPKRAYQDKYDAYLAKLSPTGEREWHLFLGGDEDDKAYGLAVDAAGNVYVTGESSSSWGAPKRPYSGAKDAFIAKVDSDGRLQWNTFFGSSLSDIGYDVDVYGAYGGGNFHVVGVSHAEWGSAPVNGFSGRSDAFVAEVDSSGNIVWHTFIGGMRMMMVDLW